METAAVKKDKRVTIIVNGRPRELERKDDLTFDEVVELAFGNNVPRGPNIVITVTYTKGAGDKKQGSLSAGDSVRVKEGMVFDVTATDKS